MTKDSRIEFHNPCKYFLARCYIEIRLISSRQCLGELDRMEFDSSPIELQTSLAFRKFVQEILDEVGAKFHNHTVQKDRLG